MGFAGQSSIVVVLLLSSSSLSRSDGGHVPRRNIGTARPLYEALCMAPTTDLDLKPLIFNKAQIKSFLSIFWFVWHADDAYWFMLSAAHARTAGCLSQPPTASRASAPCGGFLFPGAAHVAGNLENVCSASLVCWLPVATHPHRCRWLIWYQ